MDLHSPWLSKSSSNRWVSALSMMSNICPFSVLNCYTSGMKSLSHHFKNISAVIHAFFWFFLVTCKFSTFLKALGFFNFPITNKGIVGRNEHGDTFFAKLMFWSIFSLLETNIFLSIAFQFRLVSSPLYS